MAGFAMLRTGLSTEEEVDHMYETPVVSRRMTWLIRVGITIAVIVMVMLSLALWWWLKHDMPCGCLPPLPSPTVGL